MIEHWGGENGGHYAFLRGRSVHNVRIERLWRDIGKTTLAPFAAVFRLLRQNGLFVLENRIHRVAMILVYQPRVQASLDEATRTWNHHALSSERHRSPKAIWSLSRQQAILGGYWNDPGDPVEEARQRYYGVDDEHDLPPDVLEGLEREHRRDDDANGEEDEVQLTLLGQAVEWGKQVLGNFDVMRQDNQVGMQVYTEVVTLLEAGVAEL
ncbi:hypothetical protein SISNIDRAFT_465883 [Sistotremastrum niveocremeum HHB9708]|uniref:Integrase core domain-containing protein n=2 Tax=Sistotremastraceae TaxID=3402574 RepID=A0A164V0G9_9AGAM|nr:hypothetical protein SISNIDRAFT_465883 [Sistotremastrum niveocremeum HHB9708]KZT38746.1 hypothetical protein SISSUDRAFT_1033118 [Sistotremastrum suecicum HHB10207 ss-3]